MNHRKNRGRSTTGILVFLTVASVFLTCVADVVGGTAAMAVGEPAAATLEVSFPGLSSVHTSVFPSDGVAHAFSGSSVADANWKTDSASLAVPAGVFDLRIRHGGSTQIIDDVDCRAGACDANVAIAELTVRFPGLSSVHTNIRASDDIAGRASGAKIVRSNWKTDETTVKVLSGVYDLRIIHGGSRQIIDDVDCTAGTCQANVAIAAMTVRFPGLSSVHTNVRASDDIAGSASGTKIVRSNWKTDETTVKVLSGVYDLRIIHGGSRQIIDDVDCTADTCEANVAIADMTVRFPGLSSVHTDVRASDGTVGNATGKSILQSNWKTDETTVHVLSGVYDLQIRHGASTQIIDDVDCSGSSCTAELHYANLTVRFPGLSSVHTSVRQADGLPGTATGSDVVQSNWKTNETTVRVLAGTYDVRLRHGESEQILDSIDCNGETCVAEAALADLTVRFPGLSSVHTSVRQADGVPGIATGSDVVQSNWKTNETTVRVLAGTYDVRLTHGESAQVLDSIDCTSATCVADVALANLTVRFPGLSSVHTSVRQADGVPGAASGSEVMHSNWKTSETTVRVLAGTYDVRLRHGESAQVLDSIDCSGNTCVAEAILADLTVRFPGLSSVHTSVRIADAGIGTATGGCVVESNWKSDQTTVTILAGTYDLRIRRGEMEQVIDGIPCPGGPCGADARLATIAVRFPGLSSVHTSVLLADGVAGEAEGGPVAEANWKTDETFVTVLAGVFDLRISHSSAVQVIDDVDCRSGDCVAEVRQAKLTVRFPGLSSVHTSVRLSDGSEGSAAGGEVAQANWRTDEAEVAVLTGVYDVRVRHNAAEQIVDDVDCSGTSCNAELRLVELDVRFPDLASVHTSVRVADDEPDAAGGGEVANANWKTDSTTIPVFAGSYDLRVRHGAASIVIDDVECLSGTCAVEVPLARIVVRFEGLSSVHTAVRLPDDEPDSADGAEVTQANWKTDQASIATLAGVYDLRIRKGAAEIVRDEVDCTSGECVVDDVTANLSVAFPGMSSVHTSVRVPDEVEGEASGGEITSGNWKTHSVSLVTLRQLVDVRVRHGETDTIFDDVDCASGTCALVVEGNLQVTLVDGDRNEPLSGVALYAYEKLPNGTLKSAAQGVTTTGGLAHFNLEGLGDDRIYVLKAVRPFANGKSYFSPFLTEQGPFQFIVTEDGENTLDLVPPVVSITTPVDGGFVPDSGFTVVGFASDDREIDSVIVKLVDPVLGETELPGAYVPATRRWEVSFPASAVTLNAAVTITAEARDRARNVGVASATATVVDDQEGPEILVTSHADLDTVPVTGFLLTGTATDLTSVASLTATLTDPVLGETIGTRDLDVSSGSGAWALAVSNGLMTEGETVVVDLAATDAEGNRSSASIRLVVVAVDFAARHMVERITFGATPDLLDEAETIGAQGLLDQQLDPMSIDDSSFDAMIAGVTPAEVDDLQAWTLLHMIYSERQLREVMTWFWDNHFNTDVDTMREDATGAMVSDTVAYELAENEAFRANALGNFRVLLGISAQSPAMLIYLDSISNVVNDSNENYTREVLELHSMGVDGGYTHADIEAGAEIITGWHLQDGAFFFDQTLHNPSAQTFLGVEIPAGGVEQGEQMLDIIVAHQSTAAFLCSKLLEVFVSDTPTMTLLTRCAQEFLASTDAPDQIARVLRVILESPEFYDPVNYRGKIKTPVELVVGMVRNTEANTDATDLADALGPMGIRLYRNPVPTGWSEIGGDWINSSFLLERIKWVNQVVRQTPESDGTTIDPGAFFARHGVETADGIVGFLLRVAVGDDTTELARQQALALLGDGFDLNDPDADERLRRVIGAVLSFPHYQKQ